MLTPSLTNQMSTQEDIETQDKSTHIHNLTCIHKAASTLCFNAFTAADPCSIVPKCILYETELRAPSTNNYLLTKCPRCCLKAVSVIDLLTVCVCVCACPVLILGNINAQIVKARLKKKSK